MKTTAALCSILLSLTAYTQQLPMGVVMVDLPGGTFTMGSNSLEGSPNQQAAAPEHQVTLSAFSMSETEITNAQYAQFLNQALNAGLIEVVTGTAGPDLNKQLIQGTSSSTYEGKVLYNLSGTRVMKDHEGGTDTNPFTEEIEPENPLNTSYIGFNESSGMFYVKNPHSADDFDWEAMCDYQDYGMTPYEVEGPVKNDFDDWAGAGQNFSDELENWTLANPENATKLPTSEEVAGWPVTFVRWWGAFAFADFYNQSLPTEAQWEFGAKGGQDFEFGVYDGNDIADANWNSAGDHPAKHHVRAAKSGTANPFGLYNMAGNAWEWIADNYVEPYSTDAVTDPLVEVQGSTTRCWRGGSWNYHEQTLQSTIRFYDEEDRGNDHFGFRIAGLAIIDRVQQHPVQQIQLVNTAFNNELKFQGLNTESEYQIFNALGQLQAQGITTGSIMISPDLQSGVYLIKLQNQVFRAVKH